MSVRIRVISLEQLFLKKLRWANLDQVSFSHSCVKPNYQNYELGCFEIGKSSDLGARKNHGCIQLLGIKISGNFGWQSNGKVQGYPIDKNR